MKISQPRKVGRSRVELMVATPEEFSLFCLLLYSSLVWLNYLFMDMLYCGTYGYMLGFFPHDGLIFSWMLILLNFTSMMIDGSCWMLGLSFDFLVAFYSEIVRWSHVLSSHSVVRPGSVLCKLDLQEGNYPHFVFNG
jgi:hypothetical protein